MLIVVYVSLGLYCEVLRFLALPFPIWSRTAPVLSGFRERREWGGFAVWIRPG